MTLEGIVAVFRSEVEAMRAQAASEGQQKTARLQGLAEAVEGRFGGMESSLRKVVDALEQRLGQLDAQVRSDCARLDALTAAFSGVVGGSPSPDPQTAPPLAGPGIGPTASPSPPPTSPSSAFAPPDPWATAARFSGTPSGRLGSGRGPMRQPFRASRTAHGAITGG